MVNSKIWSWINNRISSIQYTKCPILQELSAHFWEPKITRNKSGHWSEKHEMVHSSSSWQLADFAMLYYFTTYRLLGLLWLFFSCFCLYFFCLAISFFCYLDIFACFAYFATYVSLYVFSYLAFELQVCLINSVQFSSCNQKWCKLQGSVFLAQQADKVNRLENVCRAGCQAVTLHVICTLTIQSTECDMVTAAPATWFIFS